jgi:ferric-dicitrate binding protein FerR (iron transport regulator)
MKDNSAINAIIIKDLTGEELTSTESVILEEFLTDEGNREMVENLKNKEYLLRKFKEIHKADIKGAKAIIDQKLATGKRISIKSHWKLFRDVATSAAAVLVLAAAIFFWLNRKRSKDTVVKEDVKTVAKQDVAPGKAGASLLLASGSKIALDSATAGQLAEQGATIVLNENTTLKYQGKATGQQEVLFNTLSTANAQTYAMILADGSKVWLNTGSSIRYPVAFTGNERKVEITGEVYFEVAHNAAKPFIVHVADHRGTGMDVQVLGTHFNINAYNDESAVKTTLLQGSVKIKLNNYQTLLKPGQQSQVGSGTPQVISVANPEKAIGWKNGKFSFDDTGIDEVMRQLAKWYNVDVVYEGARPSQAIFGDLERDLPLSQVTSMLHSLTGIHFRIEGRKLIVISSSSGDPHKNTRQHT